MIIFNTEEAEDAVKIDNTGAVDKPYTDIDDVQHDEDMYEKVPNSSVKLYEVGKLVDIREKVQCIKLKDKAMSLLRISLFTLIALFVADCFIINLGFKSSQFLSPLFELFKFVVSSLIGYVFAIKQKE